MTLTVGSLFSGIGGLELGLERAGMRTVWQVEQSDFCRAVLTKHWPDVPKYTDVRDVGKHNLAPADVICGGFPCQDVSVAGLRAGVVEGTRSGLWLEYLRIVHELRPRYVLVENVPGLLSDGMGTVLSGLADCGYDAEWSVLSACALGAAHTRERVFIVAYPNGSYGQTGLRAVKQPRKSPDERADNGAVSGSGASVWLENPSALYRVVDEVPNRLERGISYGNAVYPDCAEFIGRLIVEADAAQEAA